VVLDDKDDYVSFDMRPKVDNSSSSGVTLGVFLGIVMGVALTLGVNFYYVR
jgi:hypothetical protein